MKARIRWDINHAGENGANLDFLIGLRKKGHHIPMLESRGTIPEEFAGVWQAFIRLSGSRREGGAPICLSDILAYFQIAGIDHIESRQTYMHAILELDSTIIEAVKSKSKSGREQGSVKNGKDR